MTPHYADDHLTVWLGDTRAALEAMEPESVDCIITSPPYYSLRDYGLEPVVWGGELEHAHEWGPAITATNEGWQGKDRWNHRVNGDGLEYEIVDDRKRPEQGAFCPCGAWRGQLGLEPDPLLFVDHIVEVFRAARRVLRRDGTLWLNLGDSYASKTRSRDAGGSYQAERASYSLRRPARAYAADVGFKEKDRMMIPARCAIALQADGWWLRDEIVWAKPNPMPSSVEDRTTPAHEMVYLLTKSARYRYDAAAIREGLVSSASDLRKMIEGKERIGGRVLELDDKRMAASGLTRVGRKRSVGSSEAAAAELAARRTRDVGGRADGFTRMPGGESEWAAGGTLGRNKRSVWTVATEPYPEAHFATFPTALIEPMILAGTPPGGIVLDPFGGSGTVAVVAQRLGRRAVLVDLSPEYVGQMIARIGAARGAGEGPAVDMPVPFANDGLWAAES